MRAIAAVRSSGALWFVPVLFALGMAMPALNAVGRSGYVVSDISSAGIGSSYNGPLLAGVAAFAFRGRAWFHRTLRSNRTGLVSLLAVGWPLLVGGPVAGCAAVLVTARAVPTDDTAWQLLAVDFLVLLACGLLGVGLSWALPVVIAVPVSATLCFLWINYLPANRSPLLHHMAPTFDGFAQTNQPATSGLVAVVILAGTVCAGVVACVGGRTWDRTPPLVAVPSALAVPLAAVALSAGSLQLSNAPVNLMVTAPRTTSLVCSTHQGVEICLWPEGTERAEEIAEVATSMNTHLEGWGLPAITSIGQGGLRAGAVDIESSTSLSNIQLHYSLARGYLRQRIGCQDAAGPAGEARVAVLALVSGVPNTALADEFSPATLRKVNSVLHDSTLPHDIGRWYAEGQTKVRCSPNS